MSLLVKFWDNRLKLGDTRNVGLSFDQDRRKFYKDRSEEASSIGRQRARQAAQGKFDGVHSITAVFQVSIVE